MVENLVYSWMHGWKSEFRERVTTSLSIIVNSQIAAKSLLITMNIRERVGKDPRVRSVSSDVPPLAHE
jgi:hypothetical protein